MTLCRLQTAWILVIVNSYIPLLQRGPVHPVWQTQFPGLIQSPWIQLGLQMAVGMDREFVCGGQVYMYKSESNYNAYGHYRYAQSSKLDRHTDLAEHTPLHFDTRWEESKWLWAKNKTQHDISRWCEKLQSYHLHIDFQCTLQYMYNGWVHCTGLHSSKVGHR